MPGLLLLTLLPVSSRGERAVPVGPGGTPSAPAPTLRPGRQPAPVAADPAALCESAVVAAEHVRQMPPRLLGAISLTETGRPDPADGRIRPWPWTINAAGEGHFYPTKQAAIAAATALQARGVRSIDVGCMQVNLMYHPTAFASLDEALDPRLNVAFAVRFLGRLYAASHDWRTAVGDYHSETPGLGDAYRVLVLARWQGNPKPAIPPAPPSQYSSQYRDFLPRGDVYGAFARSGDAYGAFAPH